MEFQKKLNHVRTSFLLFPAATLSAICLLVLSFIATYQLVVSPKGTDRASYQQLLANTDPHHTYTSNSATQKGVGMQKELWVPRNQKRIQLLLTSEASELLFEQVDGRSELVERLHGVTCYLQEELLFLLPDGQLISGAEEEHTLPVQIIQCIQAQDATYYYTNDQLVAKDASVSRYVLPGHALSSSQEGQKLLFSGEMALLLISAKNQTQFSAYQFNASVNSLENSTGIALREKVNGSNCLSIETPLCITALEVDHDPHATLLTGDVFLTHQLGSLSAQRVEAIPSITPHKQPFQRIHLSEKVTVCLPETGTLSCQRANLDLDRFFGEFLGSPVVYQTSSCSATEQEELPLKISAPLVFFQLNSEDASIVEQIEAKEQVTIECGKDLMIQADFATYTRFAESKPASAQALYGIIQLFMADRSSSCLATTSRGDQIYAPFAEINTELKTVCLADPKGILQLSVPGKQTQAFHFSCKKLNWCKNREELVLEEEVVLIDPLMGHLEANHATFTYMNDGKSLTPVYGKLEGNVKLSIQKPEETSPALAQYAIADILEIFPESNKMRLSSTEGRRVLFTDTLNKLQVSAPALTLQREADSQETVVQGEGDVRFTFLEQELKEMKKHFNLNYIFLGK